MTMEAFFTSVCGGMLAVAAVLLFWRFWRGPTDADRVLAIDLAAVVVASAMIMNIVSSGQEVFLDTILLLGAVLFFSTVAFARALDVLDQKRREEGDDESDD
jgi:multicomponent Na+:H+ antiporter subunit F